MAAEAEVRILITCEEDGLTALTSLQSFLRSSDFVCEVGRNGSSLCLVVTAYGSEMQAIASLIQSWIRSVDGRPVKMEVHQLPPTSQSGSVDADEPDLLALANALNILLQLNGPGLLVHAVNSCPVLLGPEIDRMLAKMIASQEDAEQKNFLVERRQWLNELRTAVRRQLDAVAPERTTPETITEHFAICWNAYRESGLTVFLDRASELAEKLARDGDLSLRISIASIVA